MAKISISAGAKVATHAMGSVFSPEKDKSERLKALLMSQVDLLTRELGQLKGSVMKVGQMISMYGEHFLPPEANAVLKSLQSQSPPLEWAAIEKVLKRQITPENRALVEIDPEPMASASIGQVHAGRRCSDGKRLAMKIQYPGVDQAIEGDLKALRSIFSIAQLIPKSPAYDELFREIRQMLHQEVDYQRELALTEEYRQALQGDPRFIIPETFPELSSKRVLTTSLEEGLGVDSPEVSGLSQERRNAIAEAMLDLYFKELFIFKMMQTDPHLGNYRIRLGENGAPDRVVLFDFGAVRKFPMSFLEPYYQMVVGSAHRDPKVLQEGARVLGFLVDGDPQALVDHFSELCFLIGEPFAGNYDWGSSDLPRRVATLGAQMALQFRLRAPPREVIFLDRKMGGMFIFLSVLKVKIDARKILDPYLDRLLSFRKDSDANRTPSSFPVG
ncbi:AarF/ABC1/UbiB kinase family protein [Bdellovibrionota bacterium FG-2]